MSSTIKPYDDRDKLRRAREVIRECDSEILLLRKTLVDIMGTIMGKFPVQSTSEMMADILSICQEALDSGKRSIGREAI